VGDGLDDFICGCGPAARCSTRTRPAGSPELLDYWSTRLYRLGHEAPDAILAEFEPQPGARSGHTLNPYVGWRPFKRATRAPSWGGSGSSKAVVDISKQNASGAGGTVGQRPIVGGSGRPGFGFERRRAARQRPMAVCAAPDARLAAPLVAIGPAWRSRYRVTLPAAFSPRRLSSGTPTNCWSSTRDVV